MKLSTDDFIFIKGHNYYEPKQHVLNALTDERLKKFRDKGDCCNWVFLVTKRRVFDHLGWDPESIGIGACIDNHLTCFFPEFKTSEQALMFLITAVILHNEKVLSR